MSRVSARIYMTGDKQVERMLRGMQTKDADRISKATVRAQLGLLVKEMKSLAPRGSSGNSKRDERGRFKSSSGRPSGSGKLRDAIGARLERNKRTGIVTAKAGINVGKRSKKVAGRRSRGAPHGHLVALGTFSRKRKRLGGKFAHITAPTSQQLSTGQMPPNDFISESTAIARPKMAAAAQRKAALEIKKYNQRRS